MVRNVNSTGCGTPVRMYAIPMTAPFAIAAAIVPFTVVAGRTGDLADEVRPAITEQAVRGHKRAISQPCPVAQYQKQRDQRDGEQKQSMQQCASECAGPRRQIFDIHAAKPFHQHVGIAEVGAPPEIKVLTGDRQLGKPGRDRDPTLSQAIERADKGLAALRKLMHRHDDWYKQNETGHKRE